MQATPATWRLLLEAGWTGAADLRVLSGGEALSRELATLLRARSASVWNLYGPTETTIYSTTHLGPGNLALASRDWWRGRTTLIESHSQAEWPGI